MSYEFHLFAACPGEDPLATAQGKTDDLPSNPPDPAIEAQKHRMAVAFITLNSRLRHAPFDHEALARFSGWSVADAHLRYRHIELTGPHDGNGVQILIFDDEILLSVPYWHTGREAAQVFREIWSYFDLVARETGHLTYDPQLDRVLDLNRDFARALRHYIVLAEHIAQKERQPEPEEKELVPIGVGALL